VLPPAPALFNLNDFKFPQVMNPIYLILGIGCFALACVVIIAVISKKKNKPPVVPKSRPSGNWHGGGGWGK